ncbi:MAG TPA: RMD1 family protein [Bacteroidota bacterium]|nr:RMD1 family protein [Bacteroidota bacterium]
MAGQDETEFQHDLQKGGRAKIFVMALDVASAYDLHAARKVFEEELKGKVLENIPLLVQFDPLKMVAIFDYGSIVFFDIDRQESAKLVDKLMPFAQRPNTTVSEDYFSLYLGVQPREPEGTDELFVKELNRDIALLVGTVLSRSVSVEYYEKLVGDALAQLEHLISLLQTKGKIPASERELTKRVGFALAVEHELAYTLSAFDDPDIVWEGGKRIEELYRRLKREFDLEDRIRIIQQKVSLISRSSMFVIGRLEGQRSLILEWVIILLILLEVILVVFGKMS